MNYSKIQNIARSVVELSKKDGGCSVSLRDYEGTPNDGYMVGGIARPLKLEYITQRTVEEFILDHYDELVGDDMFVGTWKDEAGWWYLEVSEWMEYEEDARRTAEERHEFAIYDCLSGRTINV